MLSVPLMLFRGGDASLGAEIRVLTARSKTPTKLASVDWFGQFLTGLGAHLAARGEHKTLTVKTAGAITARSNLQKGVVQCSGEDSQERPASSPCPSSSSSSSDDSSASSSSSSSDSSNSSSDSEDEASPPSANGNNNGGGSGGDDQKKKDDEDNDGNSSDSSSDSSTDESDQEEDDGVMIDTDDEKDKTHNGVDPTDEDISGESDGSSDLENSYPQLPSVPVDTLIAFRQQAAQKELQLTEKLKKEVIADARQRHQERQRSKKKKTPQSKRRHSKSDVMSNGSTHLERYHANGSAGTTDGKMAQEAEDEWMVDCSCGLKEKNFDDGTSMIQCDSCSHWVHAKCADKQPEAVAQEKFMCFRCSWMFDCVCEIRRRPNHDDGQRMVECESCKTWQHTMCVGIPMSDEPPDDYRCPRCVKKARRRKSTSKGSGSRDRQRKQSHTEQSRHRRKSSDASPVVAVDVRSAARSIDTLTTPTRAHRSRRADPTESPKKERKVPLAQSLSPPPVPEVSPPSTPPPPPSSPPPPSVVPPHAQSGSSKHDRSHSRLKRRSERERERSSASSSSPHRKRGRSLGSSPSSAKEHSHSQSNDMEHQAPPSNAVTPSPRGKGLMLRGYSPASARTDTPSSRAVDVHSPLPLTPRGSSGHSYSSQNNHSNGGRKRRGSSARDRLAKKLKIKKSSLR